MILDYFTASTPKKVPRSMQSTLVALKKTKSKKECLAKAHKILTTKYYGSSLLTYFPFWRLFWSIERSWQHTGFLQCTGQNNILRTLLIKSGHFKESDIVPTWTRCWFISPHQYLRVKIDGKWVAVDVWSSHVYGFSIGKHAGL